MSIKNSMLDIITSDTSIERINAYINEILEKGKNYGRSSYGKDKRVNIAYGSGINTIYGDSLSRILSFMGYDITREYFVKDKEFNINRIKKEFDIFRVNFDIFTSGESLYEKGIVDKVLNMLQRSDKCYINNDSLCFKISNEKDIVLTDSEGTYTELLLNIAYYVDRINRNYDIIIDVLKEENSNYKNVLECVKSAGYDFSEINLITVGDNEFDCDSAEIVNKFGVNTLRYCLLSKLDLVTANERINYIDSMNIQICKMLRNKSYKVSDEISTIDDDIAYIILNKIMQLENIIISSSGGKIYIMCDYLYELASLFDKYYRETEIINSRLLEIVKIAMNNVANLIGLILREEMLEEKLC